jgi:hypothetical protein
MLMSINTRSKLVRSTASMAAVPHSTASVAAPIASVDLTATYLEEDVAHSRPSSDGRIPSLIDDDRIRVRRERVFPTPQRCLPEVCDWVSVSAAGGLFG